MTPRIVIAVPTFDNETSIAAVVRDLLAACDLPLLVIDDGSRVPVRELLRQAGLDGGRLEVVRHAENRGKGAALQTAFAEALARGYTHVLSFDGDGQHVASQLPPLTEAAAARPFDVVIGVRRFPQVDVPGASRFGRAFSNFWVRYETDVAVRDSQSGMRVYPLFLVQSLRFLTKRYDFEVEALTRLLWAGAGLTEVDVDVYYPPAGERVSHFDKLRDNVRISMLNVWLVTRSLFARHCSVAELTRASLVVPGVAFSPLSPVATLALLTALVVALRLNACVALAVFALGCLAAPVTLDVWLGAVAGGAAVAALLLVVGRRASRPAAWRGTMRGGRFGHLFLEAVCRHLGLKAAYFCLAFIAPYFYWFAPRARRASLEYLRVLFPQETAWRLHARVVAHFHTFGMVLLDRLFLSLRPRDSFAVRLEGSALLDRAVAHGSGAVIVTAHAGGWDLASRVLEGNHLGRGAAVAEFVAPGRAVRSTEGIVRMSVHSAATPILAYKEMLERGELIGMMADRPWTDKLALVPFFGRLAAIDLTPFRVALSVGAPVLHCFAWRTGYERYEVSLEPSPELGAPRCVSGVVARERLCEAAARSYAKALEARLRRHPYQWFNFFPFFSMRPRPAVELTAAPSLATDPR
jgi:predicted LPLAT superfamily acyltransferase